MNSRVVCSTSAIDSSRAVTDSCAASERRRRERPRRTSGSTVSNTRKMSSASAYWPRLLPKYIRAASCCSACMASALLLEGAAPSLEALAVTLIGESPLARGSGGSGREARDRRDAGARNQLLQPFQGLAAIGQLRAMIACRDQHSTIGGQA